MLIPGMTWRFWRRAGLLLTSAVLLLALACGASESDEGGAATATPVPAATAPSASPTVAPPPARPAATTPPAPTAAPRPTATRVPPTATPARPTATPTAVPPAEVTIEHYSGADTVPVNPETLVVGDIAVLLSLHDLGVEADALVGLGIPIPAEYDAVVNNPHFPAVGTAFEPDYEAINALEPDLIIIAGRSSRAYPEMSRIAPTVDLTVWGDDFMGQFREQHRAMGQIFDVSDTVEARLAELEASIAAVRERAEGAGTALIVMTSGAEVTAYGPGSRFGFVHDLFGYAAADPGLERDATHGDAVSFEYILEMQPDVLFVIDRAAAIGQDNAAARQVLDNELVAQTPAWRNGRVVYVDGFAWYIAATALPSWQRIIADMETSLP